MTVFTHPKTLAATTVQRDTVLFLLGGEGGTHPTRDVWTCDVTDITYARRASALAEHGKEAPTITVSHYARGKLFVRQEAQSR